MGDIREDMQQLTMGRNVLIPVVFPSLHLTDAVQGARSSHKTALWNQLQVSAPVLGNIPLDICSFKP